MLLDLMLYENSLMDVNREVEYDCGNGEEIFKAEDYHYHPTNKDEFYDKELIDSTEKDCNKRSIKFTSDDAQCCWYEIIYLSEYDDDIPKFKYLIKLVI